MARLRDCRGVLVARGEVAFQILVQIGLIGIPSPAAGTADGDIGERIEAQRGQIPLALSMPPILVAAVPEMKNECLYVRDPSADICAPQK